MKTRMNVYIIVPTDKYSEICERLQPFEVEVANLGTIVRIYTQINIINNDIEKILTVCHEYGDCSVDIRVV